MDCVSSTHRLQAAQEGMGVEQDNLSTTQGPVVTEFRPSIDKGAQDSWW